MEPFTVTPAIMTGLLGVMLFMLFVLMWKVIGHGKPLDWQDLVSEKNIAGAQIASIEKIGFIVGLIVSSWAVMSTALAGKLDSLIFYGYLAYTGGVKSFSTYMRVKAAQTESPADHRANRA